MIPRIIHLCWLSGDAYPPLIQSCVDSWAKYLPEYEVRHWDRSTVQSFPAWVQEAVSVRKFAFAADYIRLYALYNHGGIYLDADVQVVQSLDRYLHHRSFMGRETGGDLEPAIIGAEPRLEWIHACLEYYCDRHFIDESGQFDQKPLPMVIEGILKSRFNLDFSSTSTIKSFDNIGLTLYPADHFSPKCRFTQRIERTSETAAIHHFDGKWVETSAIGSLKTVIHRVAIKTLGVNRYTRARSLYRSLIAAKSNS